MFTLVHVLQVKNMYAIQYYRSFLMSDGKLTSNRASAKLYETIEDAEVDAVAVANTPGMPTDRETIKIVSITTRPVLKDVKEIVKEF